MKNMTGLKATILIKKEIKSYYKIASSAAKKWWDKDPFMQSAVIAYYAIFSIPGLLIMVISIATIFFQKDVITGHLYNQISSMMGEETAKQVQGMIVSISNSNKSLLATMIGLIVVLVGATGVFVELQKALNIIWEVKAKQRRAIFKLLRTRLFSFGLIVSIGFLLLISLFITTMIAALSEWVLYHLPSVMRIVFYIINFAVSFGVVMILFALMFKIIPDAKIQWKHIWPGSFLTALLFILGKAVIGYYLSKTDPGSAYGAAGSIVIILLWVSYSSMILFYGAEFTRSYADHITGKVSATDDAVSTVRLNK
jgi:membrane protein